MQPTNAHKRATIHWDNNYQFYAPDKLQGRGKESNCCGNFIKK